jgi:Ca2+-binding RTX toxin-like protein
MPFTVTHIEPVTVVNDGLMYYSGLPSVTLLEGGGYVVAWKTQLVDTNEGGTWRRYNEIFQRVFDANGNPLGGEILVSEPKSEEHEAPIVTALPGGGYVMVWSTALFSGEGAGDVYQRVYGADGRPLGPKTLVHQTNTVHDGMPTVMLRDDSGYKIVFSSSPDDNPGFFQRDFDAAGNPLGPESRLAMTGGGSALLVAPLADGRFMTVSTSGATFEIERRIFDAAGNPVGPAFKIEAPGAYISLNPTLTQLKGGGTVVTFEADANHDGAIDCWQQVFDLHGQAVGAATLLAPYSVTTTALAGGGFVVAWSNRYRIYDSAGRPTGPEKPIVADDGIAFPSDVVALDDGGFIIMSNEGSLVQRKYDANGTAIGAAVFLGEVQGGQSILLDDGTLVLLYPESGHFHHRKFVQTTPDHLTPNADRAIGTSGNDILQVAPGTLNAEDVIDAREGWDVLQLAGAGSYDLRVATRVQDFEHIAGSLGNDAVTLNDSQLRLFPSINLSAGYDSLRLEVPEAFDEVIVDLRDLQFAGIEALDVNTHDSTIVATSGHFSPLQSLHMGSGLDTLLFVGGGTFSLKSRVISGVEQIGVGDGRATSIIGTANADHISGGDGKDRLDGDLGRDTLVGGRGQDRLNGGRDKDIFIFDEKLGRSNVDVILDFSVRDDTIYLDNAFFKLGKGSPSKPMKLKAKAFHSGQSATQMDDRILYDKKSGNLYYDADGTGPIAAIRFAQLKKGLVLTKADFFVI